MTKNLLLPLTLAAALCAATSIRAQTHRALVVEPQEESSASMDNLFELVEGGWTVVDAFSLRARSDVESAPRVLVHLSQSPTLAAKTVFFLEASAEPADEENPIADLEGLLEDGWTIEKSIPLASSDDGGSLSCLVLARSAGASIGGVDLPGNDLLRVLRVVEQLQSIDTTANPDAGLVEQLLGGLGGIDLGQVIGLVSNLTKDKRDDNGAEDSGHDDSSDTEVGVDDDESYDDGASGEDGAEPGGGGGAAHDEDTQDTTGDAPPQQPSTEPSTDEGSPEPNDNEENDTAPNAEDSGTSDDSRTGGRNPRNPRLPIPTRDGTVVLENGKKIDGLVRISGDHVYVRTPQGRTIRVPRDDVASIGSRAGGRSSTSPRSGSTRAPSDPRSDTRRRTTPKLPTSRKGRSSSKSPARGARIDPRLKSKIENQRSSADRSSSKSPTRSTSGSKPASSRASSRIPSKSSARSIGKSSSKVPSRSSTRASSRSSSKTSKRLPSSRTIAASRGK